MAEADDARSILIAEAVPIASWDRSIDALRRRVLRYVEASRLSEVTLIMGAPLLAALLVLPDLRLHHLAAGAWVLAGIFALAMHVYLFNAWAGHAQDRFDRNKQHWPTVTGSVSRDGLLAASLVLLILACAALFLRGGILGVLAIATAVLWIVYSHPHAGAKRVAILPTGIHLVTGLLTTLMARGAFETPDLDGMLTGLFFGLVLSGGHLMHELLDSESDAEAGFRTSAIRFGPRPVFVASFLLFAASTVLFWRLAWQGVAPLASAVGLVAILPLHALLSVRALRAGLTYPILIRLRSRYRVLYALAGIWMAVVILYHAHA